MSLSLEQEALLTAIRLDDGAPDHLRHLLQGDLSWPGLLALAVEHNVVALLYQGLKRNAADSVPSTALQQLQEIYYSLALRSHHLAELTVDLLDRFSGAGIQCIPFKGPALAVQAYGDLALRQYADIDLLVWEGDFRQAHDTLVSIGFTPEMCIHPAQDGWLLRAGNDLLFERSGEFVELHWAIAERSHVYPLQTSLLWEKLCATPLLGRSVGMLSPENTALMLCIHGSKHQWQKLKWVADLAYLIHRQAEFDWDELQSKACWLGFRRMVSLGLSLAEEVMGVQLPQEVRAEINADPQVERLSAQVWERTLLRREKIKTEDNLRFYLQGRERWRDRLYFVYDQALVPKQADWLESRLPLRLYFIYYLLRPARLAAKFGRRLLSPRTAQSRRQGSDCFGLEKRQPTQ